MTNIDQFQTDLTGLVRNGRLNYLYLNGLNELEDEFFKCLFLSHPIVFPPSVEDYHESMMIETLELCDLNGITADMIYSLLIEDQPNNRLREINLNACKHVSRSELKLFNYIISKKNLDCKINWR